MQSDEQRYSRGVPASRGARHGAPRAIRPPGSGPGTAQPSSSASSVAKAAEVVRDDLVTAAQHYLDLYEAELEPELGGVPVALAAVVGAANQGVGGWFWCLSAETSRRLKIPRTNEQGEVLSRLHIWAGLRVLNEAALVVSSTWPELLEGFDGRDYWRSVLLYRAFGQRAFAELVKSAGSPALIEELLKTGEVTRIGPLGRAVVARRILTSLVRVSAAEIVNGGPLPTSLGVLVPAPDARWRRKWAKGLAGAGILAHGLNIALSSGWLELPKILTPPPPYTD